RSPLHGIPVILKDNYNTLDLPTTAGSQLLAGSVPAEDAYVVKKLREAGAVIVAKVNLSEFAGSGGSVSGATDPEVSRQAPYPMASAPWDCRLTIPMTSIAARPVRAVGPEPALQPGSRRLALGPAPGAPRAGPPRG